MAENLETTNSFEQFDEQMGEPRATFFGEAVFFMICLIAIFANLAFGGVSTGVLGIISILVGLLVIFWMLDAWRSRKLTFSTSLLQLPILGLIVIGLIQLLPLSSAAISGELLSIPAVNSLSLDPYATRFAVVKLIIYLIFFAACLTYINSRKRLQMAVITIIIFGAVMAFFGVLQRLANPEFIYGVREVEMAIPFASYVNQHHFAAFLEMTIGLSLGLIFGRATQSNKLLLLIIAVVLMGIGIVFTSSRGGLLSLFGVIGFLLLMNIFYIKKPKNNSESADDAKQSNFKRNLTMIGGSAALIVLLLVSVMWIGGGDLVLRGTGIKMNNLDFTNGRIHFWTVALQIIKEDPIIGSGLESFGVAYPKYDTWNGEFRVEQAHNDYLQTLSDAGIIGFLCIVGFIFLLFRKSLKIINESTDNFRRSVAVGSLAGCFGIIIHSFFDFPLRTNANTFFFLILATLAVVSINQPKIYRHRLKRDS